MGGPSHTPFLTTITPVEGAYRWLTLGLGDRSACTHTEIPQEFHEARVLRGGGQVRLRGWALANYAKKLSYYAMLQML